MQLTALGTELVLKAIRRIDRGEELRGAKQDHSLGILTLGKQWSHCLDMHIRRMEERGLIRAMLTRPARRKGLPIVSG